MREKLCQIASQDLDSGPVQLAAMARVPKPLQPQSQLPLPSPGPPCAMDAPAPDVETLKQRREVLKQQLKQASKALKGEAWAP